MTAPLNRIVIFGAGALGGLLGGKLSRVAPVVLVARPAMAAVLRAHGLRLAGQSNETMACGPNFQVVSDAAAELTLQPGDAILLTVKAGAVSEALNDVASLPRAPGTPALPLFGLQNGTGFEGALHAAAARGFCPLHAVAHIGATLVEPGLIEDWGGELLLPEGSAGQALAALLANAGLKARTLPDLEVWRWKKIAFNCALNALSAILEVRNRETIRPEWRALRKQVLCEARAAAALHGVNLPPTEALLEEFEGRAKASNNVNSMWQDLQRGRRTEAAYLNGAVAERVVLKERWAPAANAWLARIVQELVDARDETAQAEIRLRGIARLQALQAGEAHA
ncbi:MAG: hypothetical protein AMXMBFR7_23260 [Planctomycetota bacterium]